MTGRTEDVFTQPATLKCRLCGGAAAPVCHQLLLNKYEAKFYRCGDCDLIQSEPPYWLEESYSSAISAHDTGAISRNLFSANFSAALFRVLGIGRKSACLDYGAGHGVFVRMMRDRGYQFLWYDKYAANLFARGFEGSVSARYDIVTAFEVFEHLVDCREELDTLFRPKHKFVLVSTVLHSGHREGWWYYTPESGQHVAFYSRNTIDHIAERYNYVVVCGATHVLFVERACRLSAFATSLVRLAFRWQKAAYALGAMFSPLDFAFRSLTLSDHRAMKDCRE